MTNSDYEKLDEQSKTAASLLVNSIDESIANGFKNKSDIGAYVAELITSISNNAEAQKALTKLFSMDTTNMSVGEIQSEVDSYISIIANAIHEDSDKLKIRLGFDDFDTQPLINKLQGFLKDDFDDKVGTLTLTDLEIASKLEIPEGTLLSWDELLAKIEEVKIETFNNKTDNLFTQLTTSTEALDKFQSSVKSASDAYSTLLSGNYSSTELLDSIQAINQAVTDMGGSLNWNFIDSQENSLELLGDTIDYISEKYANSILSDTGITDSKFGQMLAESIIHAQKLSREFGALNEVFDNLQSSYQSLWNTIEGYNETGQLTLDQLQSLVTADENLIAVLEVENGQLTINQSAYEELVAAQLMEFKTKLNDAAAAEIEALAKNKAEQATNQNAQASQNAVEKLDAETNAFNRNTSAAMANAVAKAEEAGVSEEDIQGVFDKYTEVWNSAMEGFDVNFPRFMGVSSAQEAGKSAGKSYKDALKDELSDLGNVINYIGDIIGDQIDLFNDQKDAAVDALEAEKEAAEEALEAEKALVQEKIDAKQAEIDAIEDAAKARKNELDLQEKLYDLAKKENQKTALVNYVPDTIVI